MKLKDLLSDVLMVTSRFRDVITHIILKDRGDHIMIIAKSVDGSIYVGGKTKGSVDDFNDLACLGSLDFLQASLDTPAMENGNLEVNIDSSADGKAQVVRSITLSGKNGYSVFYQAVDPFVSNLNKISTLKIDDWSVLFAVDKTFTDRFTDTMKVHSRAPKIGTDEDDIFMLSYGDKSISASFGEKGHQVSMTLTDTVEVVNDVDKITALFSVSKLNAILKLIGKDGAVAYLDSKAMKMDIHTKYAEYEFVMTAKRMKK